MAPEIIEHSKFPELNGKKIHLLLNPLGVFGRNNFGQLKETECYGGKAKIRLHVPGRGTHSVTSILVGYQWIMRLDHNASDKMVARSIHEAMYSQINQQASRGKKIQGGQRCGEWEYWAFLNHEAYHNIFEMSLIKGGGRELRGLALASLEKNLREFSIKNFPSHLPYAIYRVAAFFMAMGIQWQALLHNGEERALLPEKKQNLPISSPKDLGIRMADLSRKNWSYGEVKTISVREKYPLTKPMKDGLFSENIFGPLQDYDCQCGDPKKQLKLEVGDRCKSCKIPFLSSESRGWRIGHIKLPKPIFNRLFEKEAEEELELVPGTLAILFWQDARAWGSQKKKRIRNYDLLLEKKRGQKLLEVLNDKKEKNLTSDKIRSKLNAYVKK